ncbi:MAG: glycosyltransferase [Candidatus Gottesmanbacteria bacterium]|nr:glycosyltransferase [Candidatus Gottesmanbacteria bacterium]
MTISVVIPAYNEEKYLPRTLESIKKLNRQPDEIIVVDGGSTDRTANIARQHGAIVITVAHRGIGFARDKGLVKAKGDIIAFTDADTIVPHDWLTKIEETLSQSGVVGVFGGFRVPDGWWVYRWYINGIQPWLNQFYYWLGVPMAAGQNIAFLRKVGLEVGGFPEDYKIAEDIEMATRLKKAGKVLLRSDLIVSSSGRRGNEGFGMMTRVFKAFFLYFVFKKANKIGFPNIR